MASPKMKSSTPSAVDVLKKSSQVTLTLVGSLAFKALSEEKTRRLRSAKDVDELEQRILELLNLDPKNGPIIDFYVSGMWWTRDQGFNLEQTSAFFALLQTLLNNVEKKLSLPENVRCLERHFVGISRGGEGGSSSLSLRKCVELGGRMGGPGGLEGGELGGGSAGGGGLGGLQDLFDARQAKCIADYFHKSLFQHHKLYEHFLQNENDEVYVEKEVDLKVPLPNWPAPMTESVLQEIHDLYITQLTKSQQVLTAEEEEEMREDAMLEQELLATISVDQVKCIIQSVYQEMAKDFEGEISAMLRKRVDELSAKILKATSRTGT